MLLVCQKPYERKKYIVQVKYRPTVPDNVKYWQVFEGDKQIEDFLQSRNGFEMSNSDSKYEEDCPIEEKYYEEETPNIADINIVDINLLTKEHPQKTELSTNLEQ